MVNRQDIKIRFPELKRKILELIDEKTYLFERYSINFAGVLIYSEDVLDPDFYQSHIRKSDRIAVLSENMLFIIYDVVDTQESMKAAQNLLYYHQEHFRDQSLYIVISPARQGETLMDMGSSLLILMNFVIEEQIHDTVTDMTDMLNYTPHMMEIQ